MLLGAPTVFRTSVYWRAVSMAIPITYHVSKWSFNSLHLKKTRRISSNILDVPIWKVCLVGEVNQMAPGLLKPVRTNWPKLAIIYYLFISLVGLSRGIFAFPLSFSSHHQSEPNHLLLVSWIQGQAVIKGRGSPLSLGAPQVQRLSSLSLKWQQELCVFGSSWRSSRGASKRSPSRRTVGGRRAWTGRM